MGGHGFAVDASLIRLLPTEIDERVRRIFMGHSLKRESYGEGGGLEFQLEIIEKTAFIVFGRAVPVPVAWPMKLDWPVQVLVPAVGIQVSSARRFQEVQPPS